MTADEVRYHAVAAQLAPLLETQPAEVIAATVAVAQPWARAILRAHAGPRVTAALDAARAT